MDDAAPPRGREGGGGTDAATGREPRTYALAVVLEPGDGGMWHAYCPTLLDYGAATWAATREEALGHVREVVGMVVARLAEEGARFVFSPEYLAEYRSHGGSATSAGHRTERLATRLLQIPVSPETEPFKREFMSPLLVSAVGRCLQQGRREEARRLRRSEYYPRPLGGAPRPKSLKAAVNLFAQGVCAALPARVGCPAYRLARKVAG